MKVNYKNEILSGLTVALALIPEAVAFSLLAGLSPLTGLYAAFMMGLITALLGGRPGMISGATGAVAVVIAPLATSHGIEYVFATIILAGVLQMVAGLLKLGKLMRLVPQSVIYGFVNGLAVIIFMSQLNQFKDSNGNWMVGTPLYTFIILVLVTMLIIWQLPKYLKAIPASLASIVIVFILVVSFSLDTKTVGDLASIKGGFPPFHFPTLPFDFEMLSVIFPYASIVAGVGLIESLITLNIIDQMTNSKGNSNKECIAQGTANILSGLFSGMGGCAMLGQSLINISAGARARLSSLTASILLLIFIMIGSEFIQKVPLAALTGLMFMVSIGTFEWASFKTFKRMPQSDVIVMIIVTLITVILHNLALAVLCGVIISALVFSWDNAKRIRARKRMEGETKYYEFYGPLFFGSTEAFLNKFDIDSDPKNIIIDMSESRVVDMSAIDALNKITKKYLDADKEVHLKHLSQDCIKLINNAKDMIEVNLMKDPTYKIMP